MSEVKVWHRTCVVCKNVEIVEYLDLGASKGSEHNKTEIKTVVHTDCPDESLKDANANYRCRSCRSAMTLKSQELQLKIMEERGQEKRP
ncbi:hypothetical protein FLONG3_1878 [Fusarium longipes]|uniref:Uncharacterized protein n=1 Tax=Fusarium longipes TaxID=694270 RepID=A0A395T5B3_9HYPO|nr:hypothetical protein FLONG3_1878 [Fusarium longipes]